MPIVCPRYLYSVQREYNMKKTPPRIIKNKTGVQMAVAREAMKSLIGMLMSSDVNVVARRAEKISDVKIQFFQKEHHEFLFAVIRKVIDVGRTQDQAESKYFSIALILLSRASCASSKFSRDGRSIFTAM